MNISKFYNKLIKEDGFIIIDSNSNKYVIGKPKKKDPITIKFLDKKLNYKLLLFPDLYFGEAYTDGSIKIENGNLTEFLDIMFKNFGRGKKKSLWLKKTHQAKHYSRILATPKSQEY